jgi:hypothetical protein
MAYSQSGQMNQPPSEISSATWTQAPQHQGSESILFGHPGKKTLGHFPGVYYPQKNPLIQIPEGNFTPPTSLQEIRYRYPNKESQNNLLNEADKLHHVMSSLSNGCSFQDIN